MKFSDIIWNDDGWTNVQEFDAEKHILGIMCYAEGGEVKDLKICHNDGEERKGTATVNGANALPMSIKEFAKLFKKGEIEIR